MIGAGTRLGPYEIVSAIAAGGMGEVYKARDTRLERTVAVKVLPQHLSSSPEVRQRFEREAKTISQLSHPHICALYDVGNQDGVEYLVMEYLEGETLAERLLKGPLPTDQTLRDGVEMADALDKAHRQGIVHRDLKPGNVMLTKSGVKLLDFGLAKAVQPASSASALTSLPTEGPALTAEGTILGTFQYMAPEQLEGKEADARTDIFALGAVLYEMATGRKAFSGRSRASLIGAILKDEPPPIATVQPMTPPALDRVVRTCLAKDPEERWQSAHDIKSELTWIAQAGSQAGVAAPAARRGESRERLAWVLAALLAVGLAVTLPVAFRRGTRGTTESRPLKLSILTPEKAVLNPGIAISPDGGRLAFIATGSDGKSLLWIRSLDSIDARPLKGTGGAYHPFWSPDGRFLGFFSQGKLKKVEASGGPSQTICDAWSGRGGTWNREGVIVFAPFPTTGLFRVSAAGGQPTPVTALNDARQENSHRWPFFLPDGRHFLFFTRSRQLENRAISIGSLDSKEVRVLMNGNSNAQFAPFSPGASEGHLLFERDGGLAAWKLDLKTLRFEGEPIPIADKILGNDPWTGAMFTVSETGVLAFGRGARLVPRQLVWLDRSGRELAPLDSPGFCVDLNLSPDQKRVALDVVNFEVGGRELWLAELARGVSSRLALGDMERLSPVWSPDGGRIAFGLKQAGAVWDVYVKPSSGVGGEEPLLKSDGAKSPVDWSLDGRFLLFEKREASVNPVQKADLWVLPLAGDRRPFPLLQAPFGQSSGAFSPDVRWVAYVSDESGRPEVYVQSFPTSTAKWRISTNGGSQPRWRRDGKELFYVAPDGQLMAVDVTAGSAFEAGTPRALFRIGTSGPGVGGRHRFAVSSDGNRFLVAFTQAQEAEPITIVFNWAADLKK